MPHQCTICNTARAQILRPRDASRVCAPCFTAAFENEVYQTIISHNLFSRGERIAIGASGGKDSCVLASVLHTLNIRHDLALDLVMLSIDEGITGYRDHSLDAVRRNAAALGLPSHILSYEELYGWSMDQVVAQIGKKGNCTYCGVFRRQALDRGAARLGVRHVVTGHNADDVAETVVMNLLRGDVARLARGTSIVTSTPGQVVKSSSSSTAAANGGPNGDDKVEITDVKRSKPLMYAYEKEIVLYAHHRKLDYFSTECVYSPEAFRGSARTLIKNLERIRPESILDIVRSGIDLARMVPDGEGGGAATASSAASACAAGGGSGHGSAPKSSAAARVVAIDADDDGAAGGCGDAAGGSGGEMAAMDRQLALDERAAELGDEVDVAASAAAEREYKPTIDASPTTKATDGSAPLPPTLAAKQEIMTVPIRRAKGPEQQQQRQDARRAQQEPAAGGQGRRQILGKCERCGYLSSQKVCKACVLLEGLNKGRARTDVAIEQSG